jgi:tRNA A-37 threonylcarbamoyl transferase component Bud32
MPSQPRRISRYEIKCPIGGGGMGTLYLARDTNPTTERLVALKLLRANLDSGDLRTRFAREAQSLARLNHPNIVNIYDSGEFRGAPFIVMEYVRGETLAEKIRRRAPLSLGQKLKLLAELCSGLAHAHEAGVIHRDVKPANLMVDPQGRLKVVDFGIARVAESLTRVGVQVTQLNMQVGTPGYMSPEQIEGADIDARSDIFAVGAVAYELFTGHEAFSGANTRQIERKVLEAQPTPILSLVRDLDPAICKIVGCALEKDPNRRYQDAQAMEEALEQQRVRLGRTETPPPRVTGHGVLAKPRGSRADMAYRHAEAMVDEGAPEAARRHLLEALAEDPEHAQARALLTVLGGTPPPLEPAFPVDVPGQADPRRGDRTEYSSKRDVAAGEDGPLDPVFGGRPGSRFSRQRRSSDRPPLADDSNMRDDEASALDQTVVHRPKPSGGSQGRKSSRPQRGWDSPPPVWDPRSWSRQTILLVVAAPLAVIAVAAGLWWWRPWDSGHRLVVSKPEGGTITANGISCGSDGSTCSASFSNAELIEFEAHAAEGFTFTGFTGDCAPSGRTMMDAPRECGATFERTGVGAAIGEELLLTIAPPVGGTIVGQGVLCGSQGKECSGKFGLGFVVQLQGHADPGYVFQGFSGDCSADGKATMDGPRTCGATFVGAAPGKLASSTDNPGTGPGGPLTRPGEARPTGGRPGASTSVAGAERAAPGAGASAGEGSSSGAAAASTGATGATGGAASGAPVGSAEEPGKPVREVITREAASRKLIDETLQRYLAAYGKLDYQDLLTVYPTAPRVIRNQLAQYEALDYSFAGPPKYVTFDPDAGAALIELEFKQVFKPKVGGAPPPNEGRVTFRLHRLHNDDWVIDSALFKSKK